LQRIKQGDFTLRGLVVELAQRGLKVDYRTVWNFVHSEKLSLKKAWRLANAKMKSLIEKRAPLWGAQCSHGR
jgi:transposase